MELPGVGGKSADIVLSHAYGQPVIACDSHVIWIANQLRWTKSKNPEKVREDLHKIIPLRYRSIVNSIFIQFGKEICVTGRPKCHICPIEKYCPSSRLNS
jgi:endonuclease-3